MLPSVSHMSSCNTIQNQSSTSGISDIPKILELINNKLNSIDYNENHYEINKFKDFLNENKKKILDLHQDNDDMKKLLKTANEVINSIKDNNYIGINNDENFYKIDTIKNDLEIILNPNKSKSCSHVNIVKKEINRIIEQGKSELEQATPRVEKEIRRNSDKVEKEFNRFLKRF
ncbi:hypothetical protein QE177_15220 (plasmid) [Arsenophonus sp. aPb]|uniref:hypothetical protein n=1 Tax=Arsenophonus sp. aPb TaxID=3041619 RepID=UPI002469A44B|nr:hypothetical protein [Arsenophonus sp. aPb]WGL99849.1 hypothetical protein QE177_15220 [Arsenophonus sp. aPb]